MPDKQISKIFDNLRKNSFAKQLAAGTATGWLTGSFAQRLGKPIAFTAGAGIVLLELAHHKGLIDMSFDNLAKTAKEKREDMKDCTPPAGGKPNECDNSDKLSVSSDKSDKSEKSDKSDKAPKVAESAPAVPIIPPGPVLPIPPVPPVPVPQKTEAVKTKICNPLPSKQRIKEFAANNKTFTAGFVGGFLMGIAW